MEKFDVIIIGAGAAGIMAAKVLSENKKKVCVLEARDRIGGRVHTLKKEGFTRPVEAGAEFIHGRLPLTIHLLKEAEIQYHKTEGELWQLKNGELSRRTDFIEHADQLEKKLNETKEDMSVADLLKRYFNDEKYADMKHSLKQYIEGYDAADIELYSSLSLKEEWQNEEHEQFRIEGGYGLLFGHLKKKCDENGCLFGFSTVVKQIKWEEGNADVITTDGKTFAADKIIITVPPIFLAEESEASVSFDPQLPVVTQAARQIGYGGVIKVVLEFDHPFWETGECRKAGDLYFLFSEEKIPTWWSQLPDSTPMLAGWLAGPKATELAGADDETILYHALISLCSIFGIEMDILQQYVRGSHVHNWLADPFSRGAYSYNTTTSAAAKKILRTPVGGTLFIAGEAVSVRADATVEAALESGREIAENILKIL